MPKKQAAPVLGAYDLTEDQHTALYQARHLCELLSVMASCDTEFFYGRMETLAVSFGLLTDMLDQVQPNLVWRKPQ